MRTGSALFDEVGTELNVRDWVEPAMSQNITAKSAKRQSTLVRAADTGLKNGTFIVRQPRISPFYYPFLAKATLPFRIVRSNPLAARLDESIFPCFDE